MRTQTLLTKALALAIAVLAQSHAQAPWSEIPRTEGKTLAQQPIVLADAIKADAPKADLPKTDLPKTDLPKTDLPKRRPALLIITFSKGAGDAALAWTKALQAKGLSNKLSIYQVAELESVPRFLRSLVISGIRKGVPAERHGKFIILTADTDAWKALVNFVADDTPYLVLIDALGHIQQRIAGEVTDDRLKILTERLK